MVTSETREMDHPYDQGRQSLEWGNRDMADELLTSPPPYSSVVKTSQQPKIQTAATTYQPQGQSHPHQPYQPLHQPQQQQQIHRPQQHQPQQLMPLTIADPNFGANDRVPREMAPTRMLDAFLVTIFCGLPCGLIALSNSCKVKDARESGNLQLAVNYSKDAKFWISVGVLFGSICIVLTLVYQQLFGLPCLDYPCRCWRDHYFKRWQDYYRLPCDYFVP